MTPSTLVINGNTIVSPFTFAWDSPDIGSPEVESADGVIHQYKQFVRENFTIELTQITETELAILFQILGTTGLNSFFTVTLTTAALVRTWDGATTNTDVNRVRHQVIIEQDGAVEALDGHPEYYRMVLRCRESEGGT